jgi:putative ABC transport system ATP-binding protein
MNDVDIILRARGVWKRYRQDGVETPALHGVDFTVRRGQFISIMGPSGCGKSTLLHILGLMLRPTAAEELTLDGANTLGINQSEMTRLRREKIGFVFQRFNLLEMLTAEDNLKLAMKIKGRIKNYDDRVREMLDLVGLPDKVKSKPHQMSIGQQQRLAIARALVHQPALLLADEPTGNLDSANADRILELIKACHIKYNQTIIMVTHNPDLAKRADLVIYMKDGKIVGTE